jgi:hypothetical protein
MMANAYIPCYDSNQEDKDAFSLADIPFEEARESPLEI